jgi:hypothetical protein
MSTASATVLLVALASACAPPQKLADLGDEHRSASRGPDVR